MCIYIYIYIIHIRNTGKLVGIGHSDPFRS